jgi:hypothetical protein
VYGSLRLEAGQHAASGEAARGRACVWPGELLRCRFAEVSETPPCHVVVLIAAVICSIFITYYMGVFLRVYSLEPGWFYSGQMLYMVWNAVNDPLFGWLMNTRFNRTGSC